MGYVDEVFVLCEVFGELVVVIGEFVVVVLFVEYMVV